MTELCLNIGNICKEVQRIQFDIENKEYSSAIDRCEKLDELITSIEDGKVKLEGFNPEKTTVVETVRYSVKEKLK